MSLSDQLIEKLERENDELRERIRQLEEQAGMHLTAPLELQLTGSEARIFGVILSRSFASKDALMAALYRNMGREEAELKIVDVLVCKIRKKVKPFNLVIETVWGSGYCLTQASREIVRARWPELASAAEVNRPAA